MSKKGLTELVMILDRSGSMGGLESDTIGGFNSLIEKQRREEGECLVSVVLFDDLIERLYKRVDLQKVRPMTGEDYYVRGCTALLDAVGSSIRHIIHIHKSLRAEDVPEKTIFVITTDGLENSSREYSYPAVKRLIEHEQEKYHWEFIFLGANIDAAREAGRMGIKASRAARFHSDRRGTQVNYEVLSKVVGRARSAPCASAMSEAFDDEELLHEIREDYLGRP